MEALSAFLAAWTSIIVQPVIVVQELLAGCRTDTERRTIERFAVGPFERRGRLVAPSVGAWIESGAVLAHVAPRDTVPTRSLANDVLLAATCREHGIVLVTRNLRDFRRIGRHIAHDAVAPWPDPGRA